MGKIWRNRAYFFGSFVMGPTTEYQFPMVDDVHHFPEKTFSAWIFYYI
jgi:hypothetical protein